MTVTIIVYDNCIVIAQIWLPSNTKPISYIKLQAKNCQYGVNSVFSKNHSLKLNTYDSTVCDASRASHGR